MLISAFLGAAAVNPRISNYCRSPRADWSRTDGTANLERWGQKRYFLTTQWSVFLSGVIRGRQNRPL